MVHRRSRAHGVAAGSPVPRACAVVRRAGELRLLFTLRHRTAGGRRVVAAQPGPMVVVYPPVGHAQRARAGDVLPLPGRATVVGRRTRSHPADPRRRRDPWLERDRLARCRQPVERGEGRRCQPGGRHAVIAQRLRADRCRVLPADRTQALVAAAARVPVGDDVHPRLLGRALRDRRPRRLVLRRGDHGRRVRGREGLGGVEAAPGGGARDPADSGVARSRPACRPCRPGCPSCRRSRCRPGPLRSRLLPVHRPPTCRTAAANGGSSGGRAGTEPVSAGSSLRSEGGEAWSADDDAAAEIAASVSFEPSVASERIAE